MKRISHMARHQFLCRHFSSSRMELPQRIKEVKHSSQQGNVCEDCWADTNEGEVAVWICVDCGHYFCDDAVGYFPTGHIDYHSEETGHPLAIRIDCLNQVFCFPCASFMLIGEKTIKGMHNHGNTCFCNSILQNLLALPIFVSKLNPAGDITRSLQSLIEDQHSDDLILDPKQLLDFIRDKNRGFQIGVQHDSHEFLIYFINELKKEDRDVVDQTFMGRLSSTVSCTHCGNRSVKSDLFLALSLEVSSKIRSKTTDDGIAPKIVAPLNFRGNDVDKDMYPGSSNRIKINSRADSVTHLLTAFSDFWPKDCARVKVCLRSRPPPATQHPNLSAGKEDAKARKHIYSGSEMVCDPKVSTCETYKARASPRFFSELPKGSYNDGKGAADVNITCEVDDSGVFFSVERCLNMFTRKEKMPELKCEDCAHNEKCKRFLISKAPPILTIHLKRSCQAANGAQMKVKGHIGFQEILDLTPYMDPEHVGDQVLTYYLKGIVEHIGSTVTSGHYVAFVKRESQWFRANDVDVQNVTLSDVLRREAYILFYERMPRFVRPEAMVKIPSLESSFEMPMKSLAFDLMRLLPQSNLQVKDRSKYWPKRRTDFSLFRTERNGKTCSNCGTDKTPQWRAGPAGPGSLCNACGLRYRKGQFQEEGE